MWPDRPADAREPLETLDRPPTYDGGPALADRGDSDRLLDVDPPQEVAEPPSIERVEQAFPDLYHYDQRPPIVETERFRSPAEWVADRNPGFQEESPGRDTNCGDASRSSEYTWRGLDTRAVPINVEVAGDGGEQLRVMEHWSPGDRVSTTFGDIQRGLEQLGPGSSAIVGVDFIEGGGHWLNGFNDGGRIIASDGQTGLTKEWPPDESLGVAESDCFAVDATFIDASGRHLTRDDLPEGIT